MNRILEEEERERERERAMPQPQRPTEWEKKNPSKLGTQKKLYGRHFGLRRVFCFTPSLIGWFHRVGE